MHERSSRENSTKQKHRGRKGDKRSTWKGGARESQKEWVSVSVWGGKKENYTGCSGLPHRTGCRVCGIIRVEGCEAENVEKS